VAVLPTLVGRHFLLSSSFAKSFDTLSQYLTKGIPMKLPADVGAKVLPLLDDAKKEATPFWYALRYCLVWLAYVVLVPVALAGKFLGELAEKIKPELPKAPEA
jgi:hypothetical protein